MYTVALVGRPNVGKSTLANTFSEKKGAVTSPVLGTTRDYVSQSVSWRGKKFTVIDTGGIIINPQNEIQKSVQQSVDSVIKKSDVILFVGDVRTGITNEDREIVKYLRDFNKNILFAVNKVERDGFEAEINAFKSLGTKDIIPISALTGRGIGDLLDRIVENINDGKSLEGTKKPYRFALLGKTNAGKSTLFNAIVKEKRTIESTIPGTTIDLIEEAFTYNNTALSIIDTAGIRKKSKVTEDIEKQSRKKTLSALKYADVACLIIDCSKPLSRQDQRIARVLEEAYIPVIIVAAKYDLLCSPVTSKECKEIMAQKTQAIRHKLSLLYFADLVFISSKENYNIDTLLKKILGIKKDSERIINEKRLEDFLSEYLIAHPPRSRRGKPTSLIKGISLIDSNPLLIGLHTSKKGFISEKYIRHLAKALHSYLKIKSRPLHIKILK